MVIDLNYEFLPHNRLDSVNLDESLASSYHSQIVEDEKITALHSLKESNAFCVSDENVKKLSWSNDNASGPYDLTLSLKENRVIFEIKTKNNNDEALVLFFSEKKLKREVRDYFEICNSYYQAKRKLNVHQLEAIDMARRGIHNEGAEALLDRLSNDIMMDHETARRLFTLLSVLYWRNL